MGSRGHGIAGRGWRDVSRRDAEAQRTWCARPRNRACCVLDWMGIDGRRGRAADGCGSSDFVLLAYGAARTVDVARRAFDDRRPPDPSVAVGASGFGEIGGCRLVS